ncbi:bifunctional phosphopantothenoylcysteine decarboxylase/phosphopantothenate--cysteine ligase CoaBC [Listeria sp. PSOL-1]|uniref:bifunctional phosphopantothenoylcysteine decarboxylase/phosphopantothenate--cysteine ligase CoaBC n=1 Tax=Listeria sp. PSOL-1 TaxID=1844999 RepID=UPI0013D2AC10|nr:bifunctional phosphopantothenoylcysteine decarboxylase/phosphopantothenate--cysteine ligase CoaBC [Listeria sp. PSOL-1]
MQGKNILLAVSGGIAVYKAVSLTSKLTQAGANVKVMMTPHSTEFVPPLSFQVLSRNDVYTDTFVEKNASVVAHIDLADWADLVIVAPATANLIAKMANGIADDMVSTTLLATEAPIWLAPAMNVHMINHPAVKRNLDQLYKDGVRFIEPEEGYLACGYIGRGRLEEPEKIIARIREHFEQESSRLLGKKVLVTAGGTRENLDPVRYLTNRSSGKMGSRIAEEAMLRGALVTLVTTIRELPVNEKIDVRYVDSADEMYQVVIAEQKKQDAFIMAAAVADYTPIEVSEHKIKKQGDEFVVKMKRTKDILAEVGQTKTNEQVVIGFAAETRDVEAGAKQKLATKKADLIVANNVLTEGAGFGTDTNVVTFYFANGKQMELPLQDKRDVAKKLIDEIETLLGLN